MPDIARCTGSGRARPRPPRATASRSTWSSRSAAAQQRSHCRKPVSTSSRGCHGHVLKTAGGSSSSATAAYERSNPLIRPRFIAWTSSCLGLANRRSRNRRSLRSRPLDGTHGQVCNGLLALRIRMRGVRRRPGRPDIIRAATGDPNRALLAQPERHDGNALGGYSPSRRRPRRRRTRQLPALPSAAATPTAMITALSCV